GANVLVAGGNWILSTNSLVTFPVGNTLWSPTALSTATGTALTSTFANTLIPIAAPTINSNAPYNSIYFGLTVPGGTTAGNYIQTISFENYNATQNIYNKSTTYNAITADVQVGSVCYISLSPTSISFGSVVANSNVPTNVLVTDTDTGGNAAATLLVNGTNWFLNGNSLATSFGVSNTLWDSGTQTIYTGNALSNTLVSTGITIAAPSSTTPSTSNSIYFGLGIPGGTPAGVYEQTITLENSC
ncbi:hypothetical protein M1583_01795, partial [Candidatus Marsarchaeota archaeon]|nr:hypothetical protein [Candidatus Marsarchaeota archaeon]